MNKHLWVCALIVAAVLGGCGQAAGTGTPAPSETATATASSTATAAPTLPPTVVVTGRIAFTSRRDGNAEIYVMNADGTGQTNLTNNHATDLGPVWSPDGKRIAFESERDGTNQIYVMNSDGSGVIQLTSGANYALYPVWSPDGKRIAFASDITHQKGFIYTLNVDGSGIRQVTTSGGIFVTPAPSWSPDGQWITFFSEAFVNHTSLDHVTYINVIRMDGTDLRQITEGGNFDSPLWSPDGGRIAFEAFQDGNSEIYSANNDGSDQTNLTDNPSNDDMPAWSPDGNHIAFTSTRDKASVANCPMNCGYEVYVMDADGRNQTRLTHSLLDSFMPVWSPDGQWIAYECARNANSRYNICLIEANGTNQVYLTDSPGDDFSPRWQPMPQTK